MNPKFVLAIVLPDNLQTQLAPIREQFEPGVNEKIPAHISLAFPFYLTQNQTDFFESVKSVAKKINVFTAKLSGIDAFSKTNGNFVAYLKTEPANAFNQINEQLDQLITKFGEYDTSFFDNGSLPPYDPHLTLAINATNEDLQTIKKTLEGKSFPFICSQIVLMRKNNEMWEKQQNFLLG